MKPAQRRLALLALNNAPIVLFAIVLAVFGLLSPQFFTGQNLTNAVVHYLKKPL